MDKTKPEVIYRETVISTGRSAMLSICIVCGVVLASCFAYVGDIVNSYTIIVFLIIIVATFYFLVFSTLRINASTSAITVRYGIHKTVLPWEDIIDCYPEDFYYDAPTFGRFRLAIYPVMRVNGKLIFHCGLNSPAYDEAHDKGRQHVLLHLRRVEIKEFSFSTKNPDAVMGVIKGRIGK